LKQVTQITLISQTDADYLGQIRSLSVVPAKAGIQTEKSTCR
jgi:hypothetical protein